MNLLVVSRTSIPAVNRTIPDWQAMRELGVNVRLQRPEDVPTSERPDAIICWSVSVLEETFAALARFPGVPLFVQMWDCYEWVWEPGQGGRAQARHASRPNEYDYVRYGELVRRAREVWVPSACTARRVEQWWGVADAEVILSCAPWWDHPNVRDGGYALCTLRHLPDPWDTVFEECCQEIGIPYRRTDHDLSYADYQDAVAGCRFLVNHYYEASTGGLTLLEAYRLGKPVLCSDSEYNGARDYFGNLAWYFRHGDREDFKQKLRRLYDEPVPPACGCREWVEMNFSDGRMCADMLRRMQ